MLVPTIMEESSVVQGVGSKAHRKGFLVMASHQNYTFQIIGNIARINCECGAVVDDFNQIFQHRMEEYFLGGAAAVTFLEPVEIVMVGND